VELGVSGRSWRLAAELDGLKVDLKGAGQRRSSKAWVAVDGRNQKHERQPTAKPSMGVDDGALLEPAPTAMPPNRIGSPLGMLEGGAARNRG
jgi:hypothetical protein